MDKRYGRVKWGVNGTRVRTSEANWKLPLKWNREAARRHDRYRVFCASLADVFEDRPELEGWRNDLFDLIGATPHLDWLVLTKRPRAAAFFLERYQWAQADKNGTLPKYVLNNLWMGTSVENQAMAKERIRWLMQIAVPVRFVSCEPLLGSVDLMNGGQAGWTWPTALELGIGVNWVICGGETGPNARPMQLDWARALRGQCREVDVPFFFKSRGGKSKKDGHDLLDGGRYLEFPEL